jgi:hypothetical protein
METPDGPSNDRRRAHSRKRDARNVGGTALKYMHLFATVFAHTKTGMLKLETLV